MRTVLKVCFLLIIAGSFAACQKLSNAEPKFEAEQRSKKLQQMVTELMTLTKANEVLYHLSVLEALHNGDTNAVREMLETSIDSSRLFLDNSLIRGTKSEREAATSALGAIEQYEHKYGSLESRRPAWFEEMNEELKKQLEKVRAK